jgi:hypothetical protein
MEARQSDQVLCVYALHPAVYAQYDSAQLQLLIDMLHYALVCVLPCKVLARNTERERPYNATHSR